MPIDGETIPRAGLPRAWLAPRADGRRLHAGVDLGHAADIVVRAPEAGTVTLTAVSSYAGDEPRHSRPGGWAGYGPQVVILDGASGAWHLLSHLGRVDVEVGEEVEAGAPIGVTATRGRHLHWEVRTRERRPWNWAGVEISADPGAWLESGELVVWNARDYPCPEEPDDSTLTPRACRPSATPEERAALPPDASPPAEEPEAPEPAADDVEDVEQPGQEEPAPSPFRPGRFLRRRDRRRRVGLADGGARSC